MALTLRIIALATALCAAVAGGFGCYLTIAGEPYTMRKTVAATILCLTLLVATQLILWLAEAAKRRKQE